MVSIAAPLSQRLPATGDWCAPASLRTGIHVGQLVRQLHPQTPVLYTSGFNITDGLQQLLVDNSEFLAKPYTDVQLVEVVARLLRAKD